MRPRRRLPSTVIEQARRTASAALREKVPAPKPAAEGSAPQPTPRSPREKILQALRRLHPMD